jgi:hypothetical protein
MVLILCDHEIALASIAVRAQGEPTMPLVRISLRAGKPSSYRAAISQQVYEAMLETLNIPDGDRFQIITEHNEGQLIADPNFMGMERSADFVLIHIFLSRGRKLRSSRRFIRASPGAWRCHRAYDPTT